ncbi:MAG TPA: recombinase family protein [Bacteroidia bacterium]|nr:recombinase family protein [Bacteroidia bacterium]
MENINKIPRAILYIRVSTDEQANKGYSLRSQEEQLRRYCEVNAIEIVEVIKEDYSAKDFNRPSWKTMMYRIKKGQLQANELLFIKWDRFSRNTELAYSVLYSLMDLNIQPQAIEQKIDFSVPEQLLLLSLYLSAPMVDNLRRGMNVHAGLRKKKKEGEWPGMAPIGYKNVTLPNGKKTVEPNEYAHHIKWAFEQFATGTYRVSQLREELRAKGFKLSKNRLYDVLRNQFYCGKIYVAAYKNETGYFVTGKFTPLISESLFYDIQDILNGRRRGQPYKQCAKEELPLRGHLRCNDCGGKLTGSGSTSRNKKKVFYYHCTKGCKVRWPALIVNPRFEEILSRISFTSEVKSLYDIILKKVYSNSESERLMDKNRISTEKSRIKDRLQNAQNKMLDGLIEDSEYRELKNRLTEDLKVLELNSMEDIQLQKEFEDYLLDGVTLMKNIAETYSHAELHEKQRIIGSIFPEMLTFTKTTVRTTRVNEILPLISPSIKDLGVEIKRDELQNGTHPCQG